MRLTVGPLPPSVYWRRRALVLGAALLLVFLVAQACLAATASPGQETSGDSSDDPVPPTTSPPLLPPPTAPSTGLPAFPPVVEPGGGGTGQLDPDAPAGDRCGDDDMLITAEADRTTFVAGDPVRFTILIRNDSGRTCVRDIGGDHRELYLIQGTGANKVWSTRHCGGPTGSEVAELAPGFVTSHFIDWDGLTSATCDSGARLPVPAGQYLLYARLGTALSGPLEITIG